MCGAKDPAEPAFLFLLQQEIDHSTRLPDVFAKKFPVFDAGDAEHFESMPIEFETRRLEQALEMSHVPVPLRIRHYIPSRLGNRFSNQIVRAFVIRCGMDPID